MLIFRGEHRVVSFLQLSEISFTRDTHGAVAHMAGADGAARVNTRSRTFLPVFCICISEKQGMLLVVICGRCLYYNLQMYLYF